MAKSDLNAYWHECFHVLWIILLLQAQCQHLLVRSQVLDAMKLLPAFAKRHPPSRGAPSRSHSRAICSPDINQNKKWPLLPELESAKYHHVIKKKKKKHTKNLSQAEQDSSLSESLITSRDLSSGNCLMTSKSKACEWRKLATKIEQRKQQPDCQVFLQCFYQNTVLTS